MARPHHLLEVMKVHILIGSLLNAVEPCFGTLILRISQTGPQIFPEQFIDIALSILHIGGVHCESAKFLVKVLVEQVKSIDHHISEVDKIAYHLRRQKILRLRLHQQVPDILM